MKRFFTFFGAWIVAFIIFSIITSFSSSVIIAILAPIVLVIPIWFIADKKTKGSEIDMALNRLKNYKDYKSRYITSGFIYFFMFMISISLLVSGMDEKTAEEKIKQQEIYNNTPTPTISILSESGYVGSITGYELRFTVSGANSVSVNGETILGSGDILSKKIDLIKPETKIEIKASNELKSSTVSLSVNRDKTQSEIEEEKIAEQKRIADEKEAEKQRIAQEKLQKAKLNKESRIKAQYERIAKNGYEYEVKDKLFDRGFKEFSSEYSTAPDGSTQIESVYVNSVEGCYVEVSLQGSYSLDSHYYSVKVDCN